MAPVNPQNLFGRTKTVRSAAVQPQTQLVAAPADTAVLQDISKSLTRIIGLLTQQNTQVTKEANQERKNQEVARRKKVELGLESSFATVKNVAQAVVAPVKNILDQIIQFFVTLFLGKALLNLINWFSNKENQDKVRSIARFLKDWWPSLIAGYLLFGTGFGRVVRSLAKVAVAGTARLVIIAARLAKAIATGKGLKGVGQALSSGGAGGGWKGALVRLGIGAAATIGTGMAINKFMGGGEEQASPQLQIPDAPTAPSMGAFGGGFADLKTIFAANGGAISGKISPFTAFFGSGGLADLMSGVNGVVSGQKGIDKVPAMLTDGEFVMSRGAVQKFGVGTLEAMNASGGGTNRPRIVNQRVYAAGGGYIGPDGTMGGVGALRDRYDKEHGAGAYDRESARRRALANATPEKSYLPPVKLGSKEYLREKAEGKIKFGGAKPPQRTPLRIPNPPTPQIKVPTIGQKQKSSLTPSIPSVDPKRQAEREARKKARAEYAKIINNPEDPRYQDAWDGKLSIDSLKVDIQSRQNPTITPTVKLTPAPIPSTTPTASKPGAGYTPYKSRFAGYRDAAFERAKNIGGFTGIKSKDFYKANTAAREKELSGLSSQKRLNALSLEGKGPRTGSGRRFSAEQTARNKEFEGRGGIIGGIGRGFAQMFGSQKERERIASADKASSARVKQAGAASIGRYYSSSDGKYYKDYRAASAARAARLGTNSPNRKPITPTPKPAPKVVRTKADTIGGGGSGGGRGAKPKVPQFAASKNNSKTAKQLNIK